MRKIKDGYRLLKNKETGEVVVQRAIELNNKFDKPVILWTSYPIDRCQAHFYDYTTDIDKYWGEL